MSWQPSAARPALERRARLLAQVRTFFAARGVLEVETPILSGAAVSDPQLESLGTQIAGQPHAFFLQTSPEYAMKRLLAAGSGDIYQVCKVFRDGEQGRWHNPEFTMLEWYRLGFDDAALMDEVEALLGAVWPQPLPRAERLTYREALQRYAGIDAFDASEAELARAAEAAGIRCETALDRDGRLDLLMGIVVGPQLGQDAPCFIGDYPASQAALARLKPGLPAVAARFELYVRGIELANGFHELADAAEQRGRFQGDQVLRRARGLPQRPLDEHFLAGLDAGLPACAGVALGLDRLLAVLLDADGLSSVLAFPVDRA